MRPRKPSFLPVTCIVAFVQCAVAGNDACAASESAERGGVEDNKLTKNLHVNVFGALLFGLTGAYEVGREHWGVSARARWLNSGLYARSALPSNDNQSLVFSWGAGFTGRYYSAGSGALTGWFAGPGLEFLHTRIEDPKEALVATNTSLLVPQVEGGYRWRYKSLLVGAGVAVGYALVLSKGVENLAGGEMSPNYENTATNTPYGSILGDVGWFF